MKNHFIFSYAGNKRNEAENIAEKINFDNITTIIEPFCGSAAIRTNKIIDTYNKTYEMSKKKTSHIILSKLSIVN